VKGPREAGENESVCTNPAICNPKKSHKPEPARQCRSNLTNHDVQRLTKGVFGCPCEPGKKFNSSQEARHRQVHNPSGKKGTYTEQDFLRLNWAHPDININDIFERVKAKQGFGKFPLLCKLDGSYIRTLNKTKGLNFKESYKAAKEAFSLMNKATFITDGLNIQRQLEKACGGKPETVANRASKMCGRERTHIKVLKLLEPLSETDSEDKARTCYIQLLEKAKSGSFGLECLKSLGNKDVQFSTVNRKVVFSTPQSRRLNTSIGEKWYTTLRSLL